jgi:hypothetical protein
VERWRSDHGVEIVGPRPFGGRAGAVQRDEGFRIAIAIRRYSRGFFLSCLAEPLENSCRVLTPPCSPLGPTAPGAGR